MWRVVNLQLEPEDHCIVELSNGVVQSEWLFGLDLSGQMAVLRGLDVQGPGPNTMGSSALRDLA